MQAAVSRKSCMMKAEYDFTRAKRGKFHHENARLIRLAHLEPDILDYLAKRARARGTSLNDLVNELLKKDIELIEGAEPV
jgi:hypothetical protein